MRAVVDPNVIVSGLLSAEGSPARVLAAWLEGRFELVVSPHLLGELERVLDYPKIRPLVEKRQAARLLDIMRQSDPEAGEPDGPPSVTSRDPGDGYLILLAETRQALLVSGDEDLLTLKEQIPVLSPREFLDLLATG